MKKQLCITLILLLGTFLYAQEQDVLVVAENRTVGVNIDDPGTGPGDVDLEVKGDIKSREGRIRDKTGLVMPVGVILPYYGTTAPEGWLLCDGAVIPQGDAYTEIRALCGNNTPDMRGRFLRGVDRGSGRDPDVDSRTDGGQGQDAPGSKQGDVFGNHKHKLGIPFDSYGSGNMRALLNSDNSDESIAWSHESDEQGGNETRPKNIYVNFIIKY